MGRLNPLSAGLLAALHVWQACGNVSCHLPRTIAGVTYQDGCVDVVHASGFGPMGTAGCEELSLPDRQAIIGCGWCQHPPRTFQNCRYTDEGMVDHIKQSMHQRRGEGLAFEDEISLFFIARSGAYNVLGDEDLMRLVDAAIEVDRRSGGWRSDSHMLIDEIKLMPWPEGQHPVCPLRFSMLR